MAKTNQWCIYNSLILNPLILSQQHTNQIRVSYLSLYTTLMPKLSDRYKESFDKFWSEVGKANIDRCLSNHEHKEQEQDNNEYYMHQIGQIKTPQQYMQKKYSKKPTKNTVYKSECLQYIHLINSYRNNLRNPIKNNYFKLLISDCFLRIKNNKANISIPERKEQGSQNNSKQGQRERQRERQRNENEDDDLEEQNEQESYQSSRTKNIEYLKWHGYTDVKYIKQLIKNDQHKDSLQNRQADKQSEPILQEKLYKCIIIPSFLLTTPVYQGMQEQRADAPDPSQLFCHTSSDGLCELHIKISVQCVEEQVSIYSTQCQQQYTLTTNQKCIFNPMSIFQIKRIRQLEEENCFQVQLVYKNSIRIGFDMPVCTINSPMQYLDTYSMSLLRVCLTYADVLASDGDVYYMFGKYVNYAYFGLAEKWFLREMQQQEETEVFLRSQAYYYMKLCAIAVDTHNEKKIILYSSHLQTYIKDVSQYNQAFAYNYVGMGKHLLQSYQEAITAYNKARKICENYKNMSTINLSIMAKNNLATTFHLQNMYKESKEQFESALSMARLYYGETSIDYLNTYLNSAKLKQNDNPSTAKVIYEEIEGCCVKFGIFQNYDGCYYEAFRCFLRSSHSWVDLVDLHFEKLVKDQVDKKKFKQEIYQQKLKKLNNALKVQQMIYGIQSIEVAKTLYKLAKYSSQKEPKKGQEYLKRSFSTLREFIRKQENRSEEAFKFLKVLGEMSYSKRDYDLALQIYKTCQQNFAKLDQKKEIQQKIGQIQTKLVLNHLHNSN